MRDSVLHDATSVYVSFISYLTLCEEKAMLSKGPFRVLPGGLSDTAPSALSEPLDFSIEAIGLLKQRIGAQLAHINPNWEHLAGKRLAIVSRKPQQLRLHGECKRLPYWEVRCPGVKLARLIGRPVKEELFEKITPVAKLYPFNLEPERTLVALESLLIEDVIHDIHKAIIARPLASEPGLDRRARMIWLCSPEGHLRCRLCNESISRDTLSDEYCQYFGPVRDLCGACIPR